MDDNEYTDERIRVLTGMTFNPLTDTGRAKRWFMEKVIKAQDEHDRLDETIEMTREELREWQKELKKLAAQPKIDGWRVVRELYDAIGVTLNRVVPKEKK